jgi:hypothetical protein
VRQLSFDYADLMHRLLALILLFQTMAVSAAEVYKSVDKDGNTVFSDVPSENAEKIEVKEVMTIPSLQERPATGSAPQPVERFRALTVLSPKEDQTYFRSEGDLIVSVQTEPRLSENDTIVIYLNSNEFLSGHSLTYSIPDLDRGTYQLRVAIKDGEGKIIKSSNTITFHVKQHSVLHPQPVRPQAK